MSERSRPLRGPSIAAELRSRWPTAAFAVLFALALAGCTRSDAGSSEAATAASGVSSLDSPGATPDASPPVDTGRSPSFTYAGPVLDALPPLEDGDLLRHETERDWAIARGTVEWARSQELDSLPMGSVVGILGTTFVGTPYEPGTLELPGPEALVVLLRAFDCVTLVEHLLVLARMTTTASPEAITGEGAFRDRYRRELTNVRYRDGVLDGYPSRLHYFSEWIRDAEAKGLVRDVTRELGGVEDPRPIRFMTSNPDAYRQLGEDPAHLERIREAEARLNQLPRHYVPQARIADVEDGIETGDIIAAVSNREGLDIAHTGVALRHQGRIHLLHAPLIGDSVEISQRPLADRIHEIPSQKGIMIARPL